MDRGTYVDSCVSTFPSVTPVAASAIATGLGPDEHMIPSMNWYHRGEERYVEYGSSFPATRAHGIFRSLTDTVYNMNLAHLTQERRTVFEHLDDAGLRTACTTYLIYRGRHRHEPSRDSPYIKLAEAAQFRHPTWGGARAVLRGHLRHAGHGLFLHAGHARPAGPPRRLRGGAPRGERPVRLPAVLAARQRHLLPPSRSERPAALDRRGRSRARAADASGGRGGGVPGRARGDRDVRSLAQHRRRRAPTWPMPSTTGASSPRPTWSPRRRRSPSARGRARRRSTRYGPRIPGASCRDPRASC